MTDSHKDTPVEVEEKLDYSQDGAKQDWAHTLEDAVQAERSEKSMTLLEGIKTYPWAIFWSFCVSLTLIQEGYDTTLLGNLLALPVFRAKFGHESASGFQLDPVWQSAIGYGATIGSFCGVFISAWFQDRYGYRRTMQFALIFITGSIFVVFFAPNIQVLFVGEILCGLPWGAFSTSAIAYASEVTPVALRAYLTTYINLCWIMGQLIGSGVVNAVVHRTDQWAYRIPFAVQWFWPIPIFILITCAPESPWFLVRKGRLDEAEQAVHRLGSEKMTTPEQTVAMMVRTNKLELETHQGISYLDCFKGTDLRRTEIVCVAFASQVLSGSPFANHASYFFTQVGLTAAQATKMDLGMRGIAFIASILAWFLLARAGRRTIMVGGMTALCVILLIIGILSIPGRTQVNARWGEAALVVVWVFVWDVTVTPTIYAIVGETGSTRLRGKTIGLGRNLYNALGIVGGVLNTYQQNPLAWGWKGFAGFFWFGSCLIALAWAYFRLPECKGRTFRELNILFQRRIPARQFSKTVVAETDDE